MPRIGSAKGELWAVLAIAMTAMAMSTIVGPVGMDEINAGGRIEGTQTPGFLQDKDLGHRPPVGPMVTGIFPQIGCRQGESLCRE
ncbi:MAG: hypothetical protein KTR25_08820 [Myxococcales bacterium]|nr:hypothetical protein [Myxococcales bacterium]